jgi:Ser/Thr protein kinase RdoA (MazF antagonist)
MAAKSIKDVSFTLSQNEALLVLRDLGVDSQTPLASLSGRQRSTLNVLARQFKAKPDSFFVLAQYIAKKG